MRPLILLSLGLQVAQVAPAPRLTYLANMGVLIERGDHRVVIDALHRGALADYASLPPSLRTSLEAATGEWRDLDLALTTHRHLDHFDAGAVAARLAVDSSIVYLAARETVDTLVARSTVSARDPRVRAVVPPSGGATQLTLGGIGVRVLDLPHNPTPSTGVANVGFIVDLDGFTVLHVGDADPSVERYRAHRLAPVDVAILPFWYFTGATRATLLAAIPARRYVASHIPPADTARIRRNLAAAMPNVVPLTTPGTRIDLSVASGATQPSGQPSPRIRRR